MLHYKPAVAAHNKAMPVLPATGPLTEGVGAAGNVVMSLTMSTVVPITIFAFTQPLPYLEAAPQLGPNFVLGTVILLVGLLTYNSPLWRPMLKKRMS